MDVHLEGKIGVLAALRARRRRVRVVLVKRDAADDKVREVIDAAAEVGVPVKPVEGRELDAMAHGQTHGGVLAICGPVPRWGGDELLSHVDGLGPSRPPLLLCLEGVDDARNLGFTVRTAEALGVEAILVKRHLWDFDEADVARAASGAVERLPLVQFEDVGLIGALQKRGVRAYGCLAGARRAIDEVDLAGPCLLAIGGEKRGLSGAMREQCDGFVTIPSAAGVDAASSLSLSHAGAIVIAEAARQRRVRSPLPPGEG